ncbi:hypothetical protein ANCDUO_09515 [Ancylostoma duodenale]|uniref:Uncharacterized protein n=1 Tax=Ancylostoma duodenale TaxID=51022 RepID=A0A0C2GSX4_9BILA|nr:hypothetical protein ANCDUO_09515 [Ancylostoma duodenale]
MTVMSYDIWKAKCAAEKKRLEAEGKGAELKLDDDQMNSSPPAARKRAHTFVARLPNIQQRNALSTFHFQRDLVLLPAFLLPRALLILNQK